MLFCSSWVGFQRFGKTHQYSSKLHKFGSCGGNQKLNFYVLPWIINQKLMNMYGMNNLLRKARSKASGVEIGFLLLETKV
jgi:hypothetical protein